MVRTLYVGNLPWTAKPEDIASIFSSYGEIVSSRIITDRETGRSRGFGFIEVNDGDADKMVQLLNGADMGGRPLTVNEAKPKQM